MRVRPPVNLCILFPAIVGVTLVVGPARAEGPKVYVLPYQPIARQASPELCTEITERLGVELGNSDALTMVTAPAAGSDEGGGEGQKDEGAEAREKAVTAAKASLDKALNRAALGSKLVKKQRFDPAIKALTDALGLFDEAAPALTDITPVLQAHMEAAVALWKRGREDESTEHLRAVVALDPEYKPDPKEYWPLFLRVYDQTWRKTLREPRGKVRVDASVPGAEVFFNGKSVGAVPLLLSNAVPGRYFLRVVKDGAGAFGSMVVVSPDETIDVKADLGGGASGGGTGGLAPVAKAISNNQVDDAAVGAARELGKAAGARFVVFGGVQKAETSILVATFMVDVENGKVGRVADLELDLDLLSLSVEAFQLVEEVGARAKDFGDELAPGVTTVLRGVEAVEEKGATEVDIGPPVPDAKGKPAGRGDSRGSDRAGGDDPEERGGARVIGGDEDEGRRPRLGGLDDNKGSRRSGSEYKPKRPLYLTLTPIIGIPVAAAVGVGLLVVVALVAAGATSGGVAAYYFLAPAQTAQVEATWPK